MRCCEWTGPISIFSTISFLCIHITIFFLFLSDLIRFICLTSYFIFYNYIYLSIIICWRIVIWYQVFLSKTNHSWPSRFGLQNTLSASLPRDNTPQMSVLEMTQNNLILGMLGLWGIRCILHCYRSPVDTDPEW